MCAGWQDRVDFVITAFSLALRGPNLALNKEVRPLFLSDNSISGELPSGILPLAITAFRGPEVLIFSLAIIAFAPDFTSLSPNGSIA